MRLKLACIFILGWIAIQLPAHASLTATLDSQQISLDQPVQLTIVSDQKLSAQSLDISALKPDFNIVGQSHSSELSNQNGVATSKSIILLILMAKREGELTIPALKLGNEQTTPLNLKVSADNIAEPPVPQNDAEPGVLIETLWEHPGKAYVQGQLNLIIRIYHQGNLIEAALDEPRVADIPVNRIGGDLPGVSSKEGVQYQTIERRYALFPQKSGSLTIPPVALQVRLQNLQHQTSRNFAYPFSRGQLLTLNSKPLTIEISPPASDFTGATWLPADAVTLSRAGLPQGPINRGDAINMQINLSALGLTGAQLPEVQIKGLNKQFKLYPDQPAFADRSADGISIEGSRIQTFVLIAAEAGSLEIPKIEVAWWDRKNDRQQYASLPAVSIEVLTTKAEAVNMPNNTGEITPQKPQADAESTIQLINTARPGAVNSVWKWISLMSLSGWLMSIAWFLFYNKQDRNNSTSADRVQQTGDLRPLLKNIKTAARGNNAEQSWQALQTYARIRWPEHPPQSPDDWAGLLAHPDIERVMLELDSYLFHKSSEAPWVGESVCKVVLPMLDTGMTSVAQTPGPGVPEMYPRIKAGST
jgi:hypothetical protein